jgi:hypothetical protein
MVIARAAGTPRSEASGGKPPRKSRFPGFSLGRFGRSKSQAGAPGGCLVRAAFAAGCLLGVDEAGQTACCLAYSTHSRQAYDFWA